ncbi:transketolase [Sporolactobacillus inulinus]|uniref:Transketolase n=1 Tax=Sporolactobacillus inulinus TaxID=2078 RepID=A0A4Y1ZBT1_9BACL|nr:transketolase [Sporolactobacillus inulinus]
MNPEDSKWFDRDRFVLSAGHGSSLLYSLLHLSGFNLTIDDLKQFRKLTSKTPGHPEYGTTCGVEATTGPLGQGLAMAVGMAMAEAHLSSMYRAKQTEVINHRTFALCGDGDLMEGVSHEAASLAGHLKLSKLTVLYDSNQVSLDGETKRAYSDDVQKRFKSYGWHYERVEDGNDLAEIDAAICRAKEQNMRPTLIEVRTIIGLARPDKERIVFMVCRLVPTESLRCAADSIGIPRNSLFPNRSMSDLRIVLRGAASSLKPNGTAVSINGRSIILNKPNN